MTQPDQEPPPPVLAVTAAAGSRLEELQAAYESAKADAETAAARYKAITDGIKAELSGTHPGVPGIVLSGTPGLPSLKLTWKSSWRLDSKRLKEEDPVTYVRYAVQSGTWELRAQ